MFNICAFLLRSIHQVNSPMLYSLNQTLLEWLMTILLL